MHLAADPLGREVQLHAALQGHARIRIRQLHPHALRAQPVRRHLHAGDVDVPRCHAEDVRTLQPKVERMQEREIQVDGLVHLAEIGSARILDGVGDVVALGQTRIGQPLHRHATQQTGPTPRELKQIKVEIDARRRQHQLLRLVLLVRMRSPLEHAQIPDRHAAREPK